MDPAALDLATGFAMELIDGYQGEHLWVPLAYRAIRVFDRLPSAYRSWVRSCEVVSAGGDIVSFDLVLCADDGRVLVEVEGFQIKRLEVGQAFALAPVPTRADLGMSGDAQRAGNSAAEQLLAENIQKGILPDEGMDALARLLSRGEPEGVRELEGGFALVYNSNMGHISPWRCTVGMLEGAGRAARVRQSLARTRPLLRPRTSRA